MSGSRQSEEQGHRGLAIGSHFAGGYCVDAVVRRGSFGGIYRVHRATDGARCSIAVLSAQTDAARLDGMQADVEALWALSHDGISGGTSLLTDETLAARCVVLDDAEGEVPATFAAARPMEIGSLLPLMRRLARTLSTAHKSNLIHGHLSPGVLSLPDGRVRHTVINGFGLGAVAKGLSDIDGGPGITYLAPEQLDRFDDRIGAQTDIYALALVIAAIARGRPLELGDSYAEAVRYRQQVPELSGVPEVLAPLLEWMLQPNPQDRPSSMAQVVDGVARITAENVADLSPIRLAGGDSGKAERAKIDSGDQTRTPAQNRSSRRGERHVDRRKSSRMTARLGVFLPVVVFLGLVGGVGAYLTANPDLNPFGVVPETDIELVTASDLKSAKISGPAIGSKDVALVPTMGPERSGSDPQAPKTLVPEERLALVTPDRSPVVPLAQPAGLVPDRALNPEPNPELDPELDPGPGSDKAAQMAAWLRAYDTGPCAYHRVSDLSETALSLTAFGRDPALFRSLVAGFEAAFQIEARVNFQPVTDRQCSLLDFIATQDQTGQPGPAIDLADDTVTSGDQLLGRVTGLTGRNLWLALIDPKGNMIDLGRFVHQVDEAEARFNIAMTARGNQGTAPHMILALTSEADLSFADGIQGAVQAGDALAILERRMRLDSIEAHYALQHFELR